MNQELVVVWVIRFSVESIAHNVFALKLHTLTLHRRYIDSLGVSESIVKRAQSVGLLLFVASLSTIEKEARV